MPMASNPRTRASDADRDQTGQLPDAPASFDLQILWNKPGRQATVHAEIADATSAPSPPFSTRAKTDAMTPPTLPLVRWPMWRICSRP
jgi:hypothetical protein